VVDVTGLNGNSWFDRSGNFQTDSTHIVERFTLPDADHINYEATIEDKTIYTRPWKISTVLYRRKEKKPLPWRAVRGILRLIRAGTA
jgi:hypothetical protein